METSKKTKWVWSWGKILAKLGPMLWKKAKKLALSIGFSLILHREYILKQDVVVVQTPEWKLKANIARHAIFQDVRIKFLPELKILLGFFFFTEGDLQKVFFSIFWGFCDAQINIPYILNIG